MLGLVFTYQNTPSLGKIFFQLEKEKEVNKGQFVSIEHSQGKLIGLVVDIFRFNPYFEQTPSGIEISNAIPADDWHTSVVEVKPLGLLNNKVFGRLSFPPYAGAKVEIPADDDLKVFLGFKEKGIYLGDIQSTGVKVIIDQSRLLQKHLAILAMSGAGKSYAVSVLLEELLKQAEDESVGIILFDVHGEYKNFAEPVASKEYKDFSKHTKYYDAAKMTFALHSIDDSLFGKINSKSTNTGFEELMLIIRELRKDMSEGHVYDFDDIKRSIEEKELKANVKEPLLRSLIQIEHFGLFEKTGNFRIDDVVKPGQLTIIDMSNVLEMTRKQIIVAYFSHVLFKKRLQGYVAPFTLVLEEAHQFVPQKSEDFAKAKEYLETIAREGRKFGACLCLVSQRPINLNTTVLSQCNTHILMRITNPNDLKHISESSEALDQKSTELITGLSVGEALMVGSSVNYPLFFKVRQRESQPNKYEKNLQEMVSEFSHKEKKKSEELDSYL